MGSSWIDELLREQDWLRSTTLTAPPRGGPPRGGEKWGKDVREKLRGIGEKAGFLVVESYTPPVLGATYQLAQHTLREPLKHTINPRQRTSKLMTKPGDFFTACQLDLAWLMPIPPGLSAFLAHVATIDPFLVEHGLMFPDLFYHLLIVVFELESSAGKHAGGGLLNLSAFGLLGVALTPDDAKKNTLHNMLLTYQPTLGLRNVYVRTVSERVATS